MVFHRRELPQQGILEILSALLVNTMIGACCWYLWAESGNRDILQCRRQSCTMNNYTTFHMTLKCLPENHC